MPQINKVNAYERLHKWQWNISSEMLANIHALYIMCNIFNCVFSYRAQIFKIIWKSQKKHKIMKVKNSVSLLNANGNLKSHTVGISWPSQTAFGIFYQNHQG